MKAISISLQAARLRRTPWRDVIRLAWLLLLAGVVGKLLLPAALARELRPLLLLAPLLVLVAKDLSHLPEAIERSRVLVRARAWRRLPAAWLPPELAGLLRVERALRRGCLDWLRRRPPAAAAAAAPAGRAFSYLERGAYRSALAILLVSACVELPIHAAVLPLLVTDAAALRGLHLLMLAAVLQTLVVAAGDRWLLGAGQHVLDADGLHLRIGARTAGLVGLNQVERCERIAEPPPVWLKRHAIDASRTIRATPFDQPNLVLVLKADNRVRLSHLGVERGDLACIFLYVDRPQDLVTALYCKY